ncbi:hypothetical protein Poli38472_008090 [Pythium oligandrum]|uniref:Uncharacterized protein n=1 Tax=Pythium oligandrum TaxID=41045 RepID=A0A8K1CM51_PYTOL|nr:hypothetical protein Poli38472_008090 [Pythium oligandrum]|eukprot:TMW65448.1 hypothetical protein Poli38472_008090 [Pythium oligandrum]
MENADDAELSLAQVEAELRAAESYLTTEWSRGESNLAQSYELARSMLDEPGPSRRAVRSRPAISDERRREILSNLSSERQAAIRGGPQTRHAESMGYDSHETFESHEEHKEEEKQQPSDWWFDGEEPYEAIPSPHSSRSGAKSDALSESGSAELFYAADILGTSLHADVQPRSGLVDSFYDDDNCEEEGKIDEFEAEPDGNDDNHAQIETDQIDEAPKRDLSTLLAKLLSKSSPRESEHSMPDSQMWLGGQEDDQPHYYDNEPTQEQDIAHSTHHWASDNGILHDNQQTLVPRETRNPIHRASARIERLAQPRTHVFAERERQRLAHEMEQLQECTFQPVLQTTKTSGKIKSTDVSQNADAEQKPKKMVRFQTQQRHSVGANMFPWLTLSPRERKRSSKQPPHRLVDRLHLDVTIKYEQRERERERLEAIRLRECTFQPKINPTSRRLLRYSDYKPIHERVPDLQRAKNEYIQKIREEMATEEGGCSFVPQINPRSREIADTVLTAKQPNKPPPSVTHRLVEDAEQLIEKRVAVQEYYDALEEQPYAPTISDTSAQIAAQRPEFRMDFVSRQAYFQLIDQEKREALEDSCENLRDMTFKPDIGNAERVLKELRPERIQETQQECLYRLTYHDPKKAELKKQKLREAENAKCTFKPAINPISKALAARAESSSRAPLTSIEKHQRRTDLQQYFAGKRAFRSRVAMEMDQAQRAECTFKPQLVAKPPTRTHTKPKSSSTSKLLAKERQQDGKAIWRSDNILHMIETQRQQRDEELQTKRNARELRELEECSFQPSIRRTSRGESKARRESEERPVVVRGLGRFLELQERAKRQQIEQKQREDKVFRPNYSYEPRSYTIPKPFKLSESSKDAIRRRLQVKAELRAKERRECTFTPETLASQQRQVIQTLLKN